ncbi:type II secretion system F family protein [Desulfurispora thermophila]|uniref:type II secretion system F family protein n=1 Tax=Desulfurispora thermophila TaxID=265470 RepID=UPI0003745C1D|nr:type II secretion system F family protein [Desulfurispora thermophila]
MPLHQIILCTFLACTLLLLGVHRQLTRESREISQRLEKISARTSRQRIKKHPGHEDPPVRWRQALAHLAPIFARFSISQRLEDQLTKADIPLRGEEFLIQVLLAGFCGFFLIFLLTMQPALALASGIAGLFVPFLLLKIARQKRLSKLNNQIGDALVIMANSLRSGFSFLQAMEMVRRELPDPISKEFGRTFQEINLGSQVEDALINMTERVQSEDLDLVVTAVLIQRQVGGNLAEVLDNIAETIRERVRIKGQIRSITAQGRISGLVISLLPVGLAGMMLVVNPEYIMILFNSKAGISMLAGAVVSEIVGILAIRKIVDIEV